MTPRLLVQLVRWFAGVLFWGIGVGVGAGQESPATATSGSKLRVPGFWEVTQGGTQSALDGFAWYRCWVVVPEDWKGSDLTLELGTLDDCDETFFNGQPVGRSGTIQPYRSASAEARRYPVPANLVQFGGANLISIRVWDGGGAGGFGAVAPQLRSQHGSLRLAGLWDFHPGDDAAWAQFPEGSTPASRLLLARAFASAAGPRFGQPLDTAPLAGTAPLTLTGDIASNLVAGVDRFLLRQTQESVAQRSRHWSRDFSSATAYTASVATNRQRLAHILGVRDARVKSPQLELISTVERPARVGQGSGYDVFAVRWLSFGDVHGEGLLLRPTGRTPVAQVIALPDASQSPEQLAGLQAGIALESQFARRLAESGCQVLIPMVIDRSYGPHLGRAKLTAREFLFRSAFELGRHIIGYELQKVFSGLDALTQLEGAGNLPTGVIGWGEGGLLALYAGALDPRFQAVGVSGYWDDRNQLWDQPIDRNVFGILEQFGDAEVGTLITPRALIVEASRAPEVVITGQGGGAPGRLTTPDLAVVQAEAERSRTLVRPLNSAPALEVVVSGDGTGPFGSEPLLKSFLRALSPTAALVTAGNPPQPLLAQDNPIQQQRRQLEELDRHTQRLLVDSPEVRREFMKQLDTRTPEAFAKTAETYRTFFAEEVVGRFNLPPLPTNARSRKAYDEEKWVGYEVVLDVFPDVIAYGVLLVPRDLKPGERRPVVVCQHGLEGRPQDIISGDQEAYHDFAAKLAERGFITFAPQNLYIFTDRFRTLQRKSYPLKKTLFSTIVPQHQQIVDWLQTLPFVDPDRIGFYGLSYGGKSAMRIPPLVKDYVLSICSADFNEWVGKNAATAGTLGRYSYAWSSEYEIFEWDLGSTFNYAEMAALIAPRPFMVERGHFDGVAPDESVFWEYGKVRFLYAARLGFGDRCELETFVGPHTIHGKGTFDFLHRHLRWPAP